LQAQTRPRASARRDTPDDGFPRGPAVLAASLRACRTWPPGLALLLATASCGTSAALGTSDPADPGVDVLFVGNSLTYWNDMPRMLDALLETVPDGTYRVHVVAFGETGLEDHWAEGTARRRIAEGEMEVVALQQGPSATEGRPSLLEYSGRFAEEIRAQGGVPALYMVWPSVQRLFDAEGVSDAYRAAALLVNGGLFPAGDAWRLARERGIGIDLYGDDGFHPSPAGSYLAALVMFEQLTGRSPVGLPGPATPGGAGLSASDLTALQEIAAEANRLDPVPCELSTGAGCEAGQDARAEEEASVWVYERIGDGVHASVTQPERGYSNFANSLIVIGDSGVAVVDSRESPAAARELIAYLRTLTHLPVLAVVNTHWHWDHVNGNQVFRDSFPGVEILGHPETRRLMEAEGAARVAERIDALVGRRDRLARWLRAGARDDGRELTPDEARQARETVRSDSAKIAAFREAEVTPPSRLVADSAVIDLGGRTLRVLHPGPAHTTGDLVVVLPDEGIAFLGDLIEHGPPFFGDGTVRGSARALGRLEALDVERFLPGHGPMDAGRGLFDAQRGLLDDVLEAAEAAAADAGRDDASVLAAARDLAREHIGALPGFDGPDDERLLEYVLGTLREAIAER